MDHCPRDWHDVAEHHNFGFDERMRKELIRRGIHFFPPATKQCSISFAHNPEDIDATLDETQKTLTSISA